MKMSVFGFPKTEPNQTQILKTEKSVSAACSQIEEWYLLAGLGLQTVKTRKLQVLAKFNRSHILQTAHHYCSYL